MKETRLIIKYNDKYICNKENNEINFIKIPQYKYTDVSDFNNIDIFVSLLCSNLLNNSYESTKGLTYADGLEVFETFFDPECIKELEPGVFLYNLDELQPFLSNEYNSKLAENLSVLPGQLSSYSFDDLKAVQDENNREIEAITFEIADEDKPFYFKKPEQQVNNTLLRVLEKINHKRTDRDVLLLYSGGKDSSLAAIRLRNAGFNVHFIHFDNGQMLDSDKPYLTFQETFAKKQGYYFDYENHAINIEKTFKDYFAEWKNNYIVTENEELDSEIRCLSCRMAMYTEVLMYAMKNNFKFIAEGARISQKFMIEQELMIDKLKEMFSNYGIELLFPVLHLKDDDEEKKEIIENGFSSKSWESKCLVGREAKEKTEEDEKIILRYYDDIIKPKILKKQKIARILNKIH